MYGQIGQTQSLVVIMMVKRTLMYGQSQVKHNHLL